MFYARKWLTGPCVPLSYKNSIWITTVSSQNYLWRSCWGSDTGRDHGRVTLHQQKVYFFFRETTWGSEEVTKQAPAPPTDSVGKWGWCRFHSTLGQTRNHSPVCKPPILQDIGNLEQETTVTRTLTLLSPHTPLTRMGTGKAPERGDGHSSSHLHQVPQMTRGQGRACYILKSLKHILFLRISLSCTYNTRKPCLFCSQNYFQCKSKWTANCKI